MIAKIVVCGLDITHFRDIFVLFCLVWILTVKSLSFDMIHVTDERLRLRGGDKYCIKLHPRIGSQTRFVPKESLNFKHMARVKIWKLE